MYKAITGDKSFEIEFDGEIPLLNGKPLKWDIRKTGDRHYHILRDNLSYNVEVLEQKDQITVFRINGKKVEVQTKGKLDLLLERLGMDDILEDKLNDVKAPMPGLILNVEVSEGEEVKKGDTLMILEAMKMENVIKAAGEGTVKSIKVEKGDTVEKNQVLIQF